ncbi:MAG TPA: biotin--[acetyl-CoA-carboxylase] ligase [Casimicrobiaceae bacterium]|nr:biotin--[acetyl-CoA-carboxylase] ligase [Casimicrobiaceae bacterium]
MNSAGLTIEVADSVDSTNSELLRRAAGTDIHRHLLVAERQTAGRGRRGRGWSAVAGGSLTFSLGWRFEQGAERLGGLSLAAGVALARALDASGYHDIELKWPNDLVHRGRKLGGILTESSGSAPGPTRAVVGVGINVRIPAEIRREVAAPITDLASITETEAIDRNDLLARLAIELAMSLQTYSTDGFAAFRSQWRRRDALRDQSVQVLLPDGSTVLGVAVGVDADGALLIERGGRRLRFVNGEVSVRRAHSVSRPW